MATGSSKPASPNTELDDKDLAELHIVLFPARIQYKSFGLQIGVGVDEIACIEKINQDPGHCLLEILTARLRKSEPLTWNDIDAALREECVGLGSTADKIRKRYPLLFTPTVIIASEHEREKQMNFEKKVIKRDVKDAHHHHHEHTVKSEDILEVEQKGSDHQAMMSKERERSSEYYEGMRVGQDAKGKSTESSNKETYHKTRSKPPRKETEGRDGKREVVSGMKAKKATAPPLEQDLPSSEMAQTDSGDEESDESSEDENESEQQSSDEEEETENDDLSTAEEKGSRKSKERSTHPTTEMRKTKSQDDACSRRVKGKKLSKAAGAPSKDDSHGDKEESDAGGSRDQEDQPKKRNRRRHRESSKRPIVRGGSSPSSSQEESSRRQRRTHKHGGKYKRKEKKKRRETSSSSSDTDSSSPESEMLKYLTKSKKKKLRKVFKYSFGQLCSASFNPVETAVQLQKKGLISPGMMTDIMLSPESQQEKIIRLVRGLDNRIRSRPERLFGCIEVLLENDALQEVGREMLRETGKPFTHQAQGMFVMMCISSSLQV